MKTVQKKGKKKNGKKEIRGGDVYKTHSSSCRMLTLSLSHSLKINK